MNEKSITKDEVIHLLKELKVPEITFLDAPDITVERLINSLGRYRIPVPEQFFATLADLMGLAYT